MIFIVTVVFCLMSPPFECTAFTSNEPETGAVACLRRADEMVEDFLDSGRWRTGLLVRSTAYCTLTD